MSGADYLSLLQALVLAGCTWYVRRGSKFDSLDVKLNTSSVDQVRRLSAEVALLRSDVQILKDSYFADRPIKIDDRGSIL